MNVTRLFTNKHPWARRISRWFFGEVSYAILPLLVLAGISILNDEPIHLLEFAELKEWSFATIVFFGVAIRKFVRLKVEIQQSPTSHRLDAGIQAFIVCLVFSVLVLVFVVLKEKQIISAVNHIGVAQMIFFAAGALSLFIAVVAEDAAQQLEFRPTTRRFSLRRMNSMLLEAERRIESVTSAQQQLSGVEPVSYEEARLRGTLADTMLRIFRLVAGPQAPAPLRAVGQ